MSYGLAIDPGKSTGVCLFRWDMHGPMTIEEVWQFSRGAQGLADFAEQHGLRSRLGSMVQFRGQTMSALVVEKFTPRANDGFSLTQDSVESLRGEGVLFGRGIADNQITWQQPAAQYFSGGETLTERKKRSREFLKKNGMYLTGKSVGARDADDAISATLHAVAYMRSAKHLPTLEAMFS